MDPHNVHCCYTLLSTASRDDEQLACKNCRYIQLSGKKSTTNKINGLLRTKTKTKKIIQKVLLYVKKTGYHLECFCLVTSTYFIVCYIDYYFVTASSRQQLHAEREISIINYILAVSSSITCIKSIVCSHDNPST